MSLIDPSIHAVSPLQIKDVKRRAKQLSRQRDDKSYMQCLDIICQEEMGLRHFHEAQKLAQKSPQNTKASEPPQSPWALYLQACQEAYFEI